LRGSVKTVGREGEREKRRELQRSYCEPVERAGSQSEDYKRGNRGGVILGASDENRERGSSFAVTWWAYKGKSWKGFLKFGGGLIQNHARMLKKALKD